MKHLKLFEEHFTSLHEASKAERKKWRKDIAETIAREKIDKIQIDSVEFQYRINGVLISGKAFSGNKEVELGIDQYGGDEIFGVLAELLRKDIKQGFYEDMPASVLLEELPGIKVVDADGKEYTEDDWISVGENSDS